MTMPREPVQRSHFIARATPKEVYEVVVDFAAYPRLFPEIKQARVIAPAPSLPVPGQPQVWRVEFRAQMVLPVRYVLDLTCLPDAPSIDWTFVEGEVVTDSSGGWRFVAEPGGTRVDYRAALDVRAPLPGAILRKITDGLVSASLPRMFTSIEAELRRRQGS
ncbi:MAG TPA: SRPBCC family protein [Polyangia bacterium]|nr:SRPBCC family protein [Polyangia bacterium]